MFGGALLQQTVIIILLSLFTLSAHGNGAEEKLLKNLKVVENNEVLENCEFLQEISAPDLKNLKKSAIYIWANVLHIEKQREGTYAIGSAYYCEENQTVEQIVMEEKKIAVFIIAYQAVKTLIIAYERIPESIKDKAKEIYVIDDASDDNTYYAGLGYKFEKGIEKLNIYQNEKNLGYGGNQEKGYNYAIEKGYDIVVMLHGDVQYAPEEIPRLIAPLEKNEADMVLGSRILGHPLRASQLTVVIVH